MLKNLDNTWVNHGIFVSLEKWKLSSNFYFVELQNEMAKLKHRVQVAEEERELAVEKERETKLRVNYIDYMEFIHVS